MFQTTKNKKMKLEKLVASIEDARKEIARVNLMSKKLAKINNEDLPKGFSDELEKAINGLSKMNVAIYKEIDYKVPAAKYSEKDGIIFFRGELNVKQVHNYDTEITKLISSLNRLFAELSKFNSEATAHEYQRIVTKQLSFIELKKPYFNAHEVVMDALEAAIKSSTKDKTSKNNAAEKAAEKAAAEAKAEEEKIAAEAEEAAKKAEEEKIAAEKAAKEAAEAEEAAKAEAAEEVMEAAGDEGDTDPESTEEKEK
jgi:hypothetical protein